MTRFPTVLLGGILLAGALPSTLAAQSSNSPFATLALGVGFPTAMSSAQLDSRGFAATLRLGRALVPHLGAAAEVSYQGLAIPSNTVAIFCPANASCVPAVSGPTRALTMGLGLRATAPLGRSTLGIQVTPGWTWLGRVPLGTRGSAPSLAAAASWAVGQVGPFRNLLEVRYQRSLTNRTLLRSTLQLGLGLAWH